MTKYILFDFYRKTLSSINTKNVGFMQWRWKYLSAWKQSTLIVSKAAPYKLWRTCIVFLMGWGLWEIFKHLPASSNMLCYTGRGWWRENEYRTITKKKNCNVTEIKIWKKQHSCQKKPTREFVTAIKGTVYNGLFTSRILKHLSLKSY